MNAMSVIILVVMLLSVAVSFWVLFFDTNGVKKVIVVPSYPNVSILEQTYKNDGERMTQKKLLENTDYVLNAMQ